MPLVPAQPNPQTDRRLHDLLRWGYIEQTPQRAWVLSDKGWRLLPACAEAPIKHPRRDPKIPPVELPRWER
jgi:hypothetical protein